MHSDISVPRSDGGSRPSARWRRLISWSSFAAVAFVAFELGGNLFLAGVVLCLKFAVDDVTTALWIIRADSIRSRAWSCGLLHSAWGVFKAALAGHLGMPLIAAVAFLIDPAGGPNQLLELTEVGLAFALADAVGIGTCTVLTWAAVFPALKSGRKLWVNSSLARSRRHGFWPPEPFGKNRAELLIWVAAFGSALLAVAAVLWFVESAGLAQDPGQRMLVFFGSVFVAMLLVLLTVTRLERVIATAPEECWPESIRSD